MIVLPSYKDTGLTIITPHLVTSLPSSSSQSHFSSPSFHNDLARIPSPTPTPIHHPTESVYFWNPPKTFFKQLPLPHSFSNTSHSSSESPSINHSTEYGSVQNSTGSPYIIVQPQNVAEAVSENENVVTPNIEPQIHVSVPSSSQQSPPPQIIVNEPNPLSLSNPTTWIIVGLLVVLILVIIIEGVK